MSNCECGGFGVLKTIRCEKCGAGPSSPEPSGAQLSTEYKAALWDGLMACGRIRVLGLARDGDDGKQGPINHIGLELWATFEPTLAVQINTGIGRGLLAEFARGVANPGGPE